MAPEAVWATALGHGAMATAPLHSSRGEKTGICTVETGLAMLRDGGDFADGVIAHPGEWLGGETFVSFDKKTVAVLAGQGLSTRLLT
jgi:hypothetical protein